MEGEEGVENARIVEAAMRRRASTAGVAHRSAASCVQRRSAKNTSCTASAESAPNADKEYVSMQLLTAVTQAAALSARSSAERTGALAQKRASSAALLKRSSASYESVVIYLSRLSGF